MQRQGVSQKSKMLHFPLFDRFMKGWMFKDKFIHHVIILCTEHPMYKTN